MASNWAAVVANDLFWMAFVSVRSPYISRSSVDGLVAAKVVCRKQMVSEITTAWLSRLSSVKQR